MPQNPPIRPSWLDEQLLECVRKSNTLSIEQYSSLIKYVIKESKIIEGDPKSDINALIEELKIKPQHVDILVKILTNFYKMLSTVIIKPTALKQLLQKEMQMSNETATVFVKLWSEDTTKEFGNFEAQKRLDNVSWQVNLETYNSQSGSKMRPKVTVQFELSELLEKTNDNVVIDFSESQLQELYNVCEAIQEKLDSEVLL